MCHCAAVGKFRDDTRASVDFASRPWRSSNYSLTPSLSQGQSRLQLSCASVLDSFSFLPSEEDFNMQERPYQIPMLIPIFKFHHLTPYTNPLIWPRKQAFVRNHLLSLTRLPSRTTRYQKPSNTSALALPVLTIRAMTYWFLDIQQPWLPVRQTFGTEVPVSSLLLMLSPQQMVCPSSLAVLTWGQHSPGSAAGTGMQGGMPSFLGLPGWSINKQARWGISSTGWRSFHLNQQIQTYWFYKFLQKSMCWEGGVFSIF